MRRRNFLRSLAALGTLSVSAESVLADSKLEPGTWYDATVTDVTDGDTIDVELDSDGTEYEIRTLGFDSPETKRNSNYENVTEWEGIEDDKYLSDWGENAKDYAQNQLPAGTDVKIAVDEREDEIDPYDRLLAYVRYDKSGDGSMDTLYNEEMLELGYARVYGSSLTRHDEFWQAERRARDAGRRVWQQSDPENTTEVDNEPVEEVFVPNASSVRTDSGAIDPGRVPVFADSTAYQDADSGAVDYTEIPLVGVDEANNTALVGGLSINEDHESDQQGQHEVFLTNLVDYLSSKSGRILIAGAHREFNETYALSSEDAVYYQRFLEGVGISFEQVNAFDGAYDNDLDSARGIVLTTPPLSYTSDEIDALSTFVSNGGAVILMGSAAATDIMRSNLDDLAAGLGSDLRLNADQVYDDSSNVGSSNLLLASNFDTSFPLFDAYSDDTGGGNDAPSCSTVDPSDGDTVSGTVTVQVDAADSEDDDTTLDVEVSIDGGTYQTASYNSTSGYYEYDWDTTAVSDGDHTVDARATDSDGATTDAAQVTVTVDNTAGAPTVDALSLSEVETDDGDAEFDADWQVSDGDGDLDTVDLVLTQDSDGSTEDSATVSVGGDAASGTTRLVAAGDDGSGNSYTVELTVTDAAGNTASDTASATESESTSGGPTVDSVSLTEQNGGGDPHAEFDADWQVSDDDGDLDTVDVTLRDLDDGETEGTDSKDVSGGSASGTSNLTAKKEENSGHTYEVEVVVTDASGNTDSGTAQEVEDGS